MTGLDDLGYDVHDYVRELTRPHLHREPYIAKVGDTSWTRHHQVKVPSLVHQLHHSSPSGEGAERGGGYKSRPAGRIEALDTLVRIDLAAARWVRDLGEDDPGDELVIVRRSPAHRGPTCAGCCQHSSCAAVRRGEYVERRAVPGSGTTACLTLLGSLWPSTETCGTKPKLGCCARHEIEHDVRRWWTQARIITGWDTAPWRPDGTCPGCERRGSLRVRLEDRAGFCVECHEMWDHTTYQQLAHHIRTEAEQQRSSSTRPRSTTGPCWCSWPRAIDDDARFVAMCERCRSLTCRHATTIPEQTAC